MIPAKDHWVIPIPWLGFESLSSVSVAIRAIRGKTSVARNALPEMPENRSVSDIIRVICGNELANKKALRYGRASRSGWAEALLDLGRALELRGELFDAAGRVDEALLAGVGGMRVHGHVTQDHEVVLAVDLLGAGGLHRGPGEEFLAGSDVEEADVVEGGMSCGLHGKGWLDQPWRAL